VPTIYVENQPYEVPEGQNLLHVCLSLGFNIPYFCWHPAMHSVGACRLCAVKQYKDENDTKGKIVMSCMTLAKDGTRISIEDAETVKFRRAVMEWLMLNHPHDCPVCDEGGECHLQDMTEMVGHVYRRARFQKRTFRNEYLGPFIRHEMNRCIQCYRCVRFYVDYAGGRDLDVFGWHDHVYFGRHEEGRLENKFSGNLIEVCPTGVFTDKTFAQHFARKWDLQTAPSICVHCGLGCNTIPGERYGILRRIRNRYNDDVNGYWLCDRGRFGYEFVNHPRRIRQPLHGDTPGHFTPISRDAALSQVGQLVRSSDVVVGIGSARASLESNFALRALVGPENFYLGESDPEMQVISSIADILRRGSVRSASLSDVTWADAVFMLGEDVPNTAPLLELAMRRSILRKPSAIAKQLHIEPWNDAAVREALQTEKGPLHVATTHATDLDPVSTQVYHGAPQDIARLGFAVANRIDAESPAVEGLSEDMKALAGRVADDLLAAERPLVLSGASSGDCSVLEAAFNVALALNHKDKNAGICTTVPWCNSLGLGLISGKPLGSVIDVVRPRSAATMIVLENDIYRHLDVARADELVHAANRVVTIDHVESRTTARSDIVLSAATFAESTGTLVNNEGRAQRFFRVFHPDGDIQDSWRWLGEIMVAAGKCPSTPWPALEDIVADLAREIPDLASITQASPPADFRIVGERVPRQPHRYSGRTAIHAAASVHEPQTPEDPDTPLSFSMEGYEGSPPAALITHFWAPGWNSVQSVNKYQKEVGDALIGGSVGKRLFEPRDDGDHAYFTEIPEAFERRDGYLLVVPAHHVFGSEDLSSLSPAIAMLAVKPYIAVNPRDAAEFTPDANGHMEIAFPRVSHHVPVRSVPMVPVGLAVAPYGLADMPWDGIPFWWKFSRA
jgi:NADH-quinone oxidoreductase subunit G